MFLNSVAARPWDGPKKVRDVRIVLLDVSSPTAMAEAEAIGKGRLTTAYLRSLPRDERREPDAGAEAPAAVPEPPRPDGVQDEPMDAREASRKRRAEDAGHEADDAGRGGSQPDLGSMVDDSMPELRREAEALGADAVALVSTYSSTSRSELAHPD